MNVDSSRSHAMLSITVEASGRGLGAGDITSGSLHIVDLAGSERQSKVWCAHLLPELHVWCSSLDAEL